MYGPHDRGSIIISGSIQVTPSLSDDDTDLLDVLSNISVRAALADSSSALVDRLAPGHPEGPNCWIACENGCCVEVGERGFVHVEGIEPWLAHLVGTLFVDHAFSGSLVIWDSVDRTFTALTVDGTRVTRRAILEPRRRAGGKRRTLEAVGG